jgi:protein TonB
MNGRTPGKGLAIASLGLGFVSLLTAGGCGLGALVGLTLGAVALVRARRTPGIDGGADVAWAGIVTNVLGALTLVPVLALLVTLQRMGTLPGAGGDELPEPPTPSAFVEAGEPPALAPPPPPPPPPRLSEPPTQYARPRVDPSAPATPVVPVRLVSGILEPKRLHSVSPVYPDIARQARVQGKVVLEATINPQGRVISVRVMEGVPLLDQAAVDAVKQWEYTPTLLNGVAVPVIMTVTVNFRLN